MGSIDWIALLEERNKLAFQLTTDIPRALESPGITIGQVRRLYLTLEECADDLKDFVAVMDDEVADDALHEAGFRLRRAMSALLRTVAHKGLMLQDAVRDASPASLPPTSEHTDAAAPSQSR